MKSVKRALALVLSLVMLISTMSVTTFAATPSEQKASLSDAKVTIAPQTYTGKTLTAESITVEVNGVALVEGTDYVVTENKGGKNSGDYEVVIEGKGKYEGSVTGTFTIEAAAKKKDTQAKVEVPAKAVTVSEKKATTVSATLVRNKNNKGEVSFKLSKKAPKKLKKQVNKMLKKGKEPIKVKVTKKGKVKITFAKSLSKLLKGKKVKGTLVSAAYNNFKAKKFPTTLKFKKA